MASEILTPNTDVSRVSNVSDAPNAATPADASLTHVLRRLELIEARVRAAVARRRVGDPDTDDRFRGLYISPAHVDRLLLRDQAPPAPDEAAARALEETERHANAAAADGDRLRLRNLARSFGLNEIDIELVLIAMAPDVDARFEKLYGYLQDDVSRRRASIGLGLELCGVPSTSAFARGRLAPGSPLVESGLMLIEDPERPTLTRSLRVPDRVTAYLLGGDAVDPSVAARTYDPTSARQRTQRAFSPAGSATCRPSLPMSASARAPPVPASPLPRSRSWAVPPLRST